MIKKNTYGVIYKKYAKLSGRFMEFKHFIDSMMYMSYRLFPPPVEEDTDSDIEDETFPTLQT